MNLDTETRFGIKVLVFVAALVVLVAWVSS